MRNISKPIDNNEARKKSPPPVETNARSKELYLGNNGKLHRIYLEGYEDEYHATPAEQAAWKEELIARNLAGLRTERNDILLGSLLETLHYHDAAGDAERILLERAAKGDLRDRQAVAYALWHGAQNEKGVELLLGLLREDDPDRYWRDYVFNTLFQLRDSRTAQDFVLACLRGEDEWYFKKAVDVLRMWGLRGETGLQDGALLGALRWGNKMEGTLQKIASILGPT